MDIIGGMIFRQSFLDGIRGGTVTLAFRRWRRPTVRAGGTLLTAVGQLNITSVDPTELDTISEADARHAGYTGRAALVAELERAKPGTVYRIALGRLEPDPRIALRAARVQGEVEQQTIREALGKLDARAPGGPWTVRTLALIRQRPGVRAGDLSRAIGQDLPRFKQNVRKLKALGLTESLEVGYRLSPRGEQVFAALEDEDGGLPSRG